MDKTPRSRTLRPWLIAALLGLGTLVWAQTAPVRIVIIGDSTVCNYAASKAPWAGWGQVIGNYFKPGTVTILNNAVGGRSSRSFVTKGQWATTSSALKAGDYLFIQFGHNDRDFTDTTRYTDTATYKQYLGMYITQARAKGVHPVLVTPMNMNTWTDTTKRTVREVFTEGANNYRAAMIHVGDSLHVPVLDLEKKSTLLMDTLGSGYMTKWHFMGLDTGEYPNYPTGYADGTHFQEMGSLENARMVTEEISRLAADTVLKPLAALVTRKQLVTVKSNLASGGTITKSRVFPWGANVTLKVKPATGKTFRYWADAKGDSVTGSTHLTFAMDSLTHTYTAMFVGGTTGILPKSAADASIRQVGRTLVLSSRTSLRRLEIRDASGRLFLSRALRGTRANLDLDPTLRGELFATLQCEDGTASQTIRSLR